MMEQPHSSPQASPRGSMSAGAPPAVDAAYVQSQMHALYAQVQQSFVAQGSPSVAAVRGPDLPRIRQPSSFAGAMGFGVDDWISEMTLQFEYYASKFPSEGAQVLFASSFLTGPALHWWEHQADRTTVTTWREFVHRLHLRFRPVQAAMLARQKLGKLTQRAGQSVNQYASAFQITLTPITDMGAADQVHHFVAGLLGAVAGKVWERQPATLKEAIDYAVSVEAMSNFGRASLPSNYRGHGQSYSSHSTSAPMEVNNIGHVGDLEQKYSEESESEPLDPVMLMLAKMESMEKRLNALHQSGSGSSSYADGRRNHDRSRIPDLKPGDIAQLQKDGRCFRCKKKGHMKNECPDPPKNE